MEFPSFSIVIPTYSRRELLTEVVGALSRIEYAGPFNLIVVVDGSTDGTAAALAKLSTAFPIKVIEQSNAGAASARNRGAQEATGDVILFLDDDMLCAPDILQQHARSIASGADAVVGDISLDPSSPSGFLSRAADIWARERTRQLRSAETLSPFDILTGHLAVTRSVFEAIQGFDARFTKGGLWGNEDLDLGVRLLERYKVVFNADARAYQRYIISPQHYLRQWQECAGADLAFAAKHPALASDLHELRGGTLKRSRFLFRPLSVVPGLSALTSRLAIRVASRVSSKHGRSDKLAGRMVYVARELTYWSSRRSARRQTEANDIRVLCYHALQDLSQDPVLADYGIDVPEFIQQIDGLAAAGYTFISAQELVSHLKGKTTLPPQPLLLTFDDCYEELLSVARDILQPRGIPALAFAVSGVASSTNEWDQAIGARRLPLLDAPGLRELAKLGVEVGSHSRGHRELINLPDADLRDETIGSADDLQALGLARPRFFAYPYGSVDRRSKAAVQAAGYTAGFGLARDTITRSADSLALPRIEILARDTGWRFRAKIRWPRLSARMH